MSQGTALLWQGPCGHAAPRIHSLACECSARGSDLQAARRAGRAASSTLLTGWDMCRAVQVAWVPALRPAAPSRVQLSPPVQGLKLPGSTGDTDGEGDNGSPKARASAQHSESMEGAWLQGRGWQGSLLCQGYPYPRERAAPHPAGLPHALPAPQALWGRGQVAGHSHTVHPGSCPH